MAKHHSLANGGRGSSSKRYAARPAPYDRHTPECTAVNDRSAREVCICNPASPDWYPPESCGGCSADLGPSRTYPWHYSDEDCRAVRKPIGAA